MPASLCLPTELYLDFNATSPVLAEAAEAAWRTMRQDYGNPSSVHAAGLRARALLEETRRCAREVLEAPSGRMVFTSGATEGIQTAVLSALCGLRERRAQGLPAGRVLMYGATEHKVVPEALAHWCRVLGLDFELRALPVDARGRHDLAALRAALPELGLLCTMAANNETGVISDLEGIEAVLQGADLRPLWLVDGVQALGKLRLRLGARAIDYAAFSGHKLHAPKGVGLLYVREGAPFTPLLAGGGQEDGARSGTENLPGIAALGVVLRALRRGDTFNPPERQAGYRARVAEALRTAFPGLVFNADVQDGLPTTLNISLPGLAPGRLMGALEAAGLLVSAGSACSAAQAKPSAVLAAMGLPPERSTNALRLSLDLCTDAHFVDQVCERLLACGEALRQAQALDEAGEPAQAQPAVPPLPQAEEPAAVAPEGLLDWLGRHPQARLVDVRETHEHLASGLVQLGGQAVHPVPLARLTPTLARWQAEAARPLLFFCRSGARSRQAAQLARAQGLGQVWQLEGGLLALAQARAVHMPVAR